MRRLTYVAIASVFTILAVVPSSQGEKPKTLLRRVAEWQYLGSEINGATMSDVATLNANGKRTVASIQCKTVMTTADPITKVFEYY